MFLRPREIPLGTFSYSGIFLFSRFLLSFFLSLSGPFFFPVCILALIFLPLKIRNSIHMEKFVGINEIAEPSASILYRRLRTSESGRRGSIWCRLFSTSTACDRLPVCLWRLFVFFKDSSMRSLTMRISYQLYL